MNARYTDYSNIDEVPFGKKPLNLDHTIQKGIQQRFKKELQNDDPHIYVNSNSTQVNGKPGTKIRESVQINQPHPNMPNLGLPMGMPSGAVGPHSPINLQLQQQYLENKLKMDDSVTKLRQKLGQIEAEEKILTQQNPS